MPDISTKPSAVNPSRWRIQFPAAEWLRGYQPRWLRGDVMAGITLAAYALPAGIGDASLAGLPPEAGLYACLFSGLVFWMFCSSRLTAISVTSAISLMLGSSLGTLAGGDASRFGALAACTALITAALAFAAWLVRAGVIVNFISETVMLGFKSGVAMYLGSTQLPKLFGFKASHGDFWERMGTFVTHLDDTNIAALLLGLGSLAVLILGKIFLKNKPVAILVVIGGIAVSSMAGLQARGVKMLGDVPQGLPTIGLPEVRLADINELLPLAMACFLLGAVETVAIGRTFAAKYGGRLDANREFLALGWANLAVGLGRGFPVSGGMSQSLVNEGAGAKTPLSGLVASLLILLVTVFLSSALRDLPQPVLAAIVLFAVAGLFKVEGLSRLWRVSRSEFAIAIAAMFGVLGSGILRGVLIGAILSLLFLLRRGSRPSTTELGRVPGTDFFADRIRHPENERVPGVFAFRVDSSLLYFNIEHVRERFFELLADRGPDVRLAVFFMGTAPTIDLSGSDFLTELCATLRERGITLKLAEAHGGVRDTLRRTGFEKLYGPVVANQPTAAVIREWEAADSDGAMPGVDQDEE